VAQRYAEKGRGEKAILDIEKDKEAQRKPRRENNSNGKKDTTWQRGNEVTRKNRPDIGSQSFWTAEAQRWRRDTRRKAEGEKANPDIGKDKESKKRKKSRKEEDTTWRRGNGVVRKNRPDIENMCDRLFLRKKLIFFDLASCIRGCSCVR